MKRQNTIWHKPTQLSLLVKAGIDTIPKNFSIFVNHLKVKAYKHKVFTFIYYQYFAVFQLNSAWHLRTCDL
ncbi:hypothetical protein [Microscilla marina]|uniref:Uncharacterized protein n=1 Tax=Microscilla marina ATCC 23134 TaxID=313606 RepID=A1ZJN4_MICM2|nr:hypothetical protein [Microscilla marina]EAY29337.1 hypothetical protein M23134_01393 [Microscilla marina ATCC 23134]